MTKTASNTPEILIQNASNFDGKKDMLAADMSVLIEGNKIRNIAKSIPVPVGATVW